ncbi:hypothetical protein GCM10022224_088670 [Nonomuraea antimicrobica]|uniref:HTH marR-type domain-containing protein n=1 Tax=Nonomuraea antimicrobica TaxID=561173 RepID=A0ABP7DTS4_9ACTN
MSEHHTITTGSSPEQVGLALLTTAHNIREEVDRHMISATGISLSRTKVLQALAAHGTVHQARLADILGQAPRSVTQAVESLERLGLIDRTGNAEDRRRKTVSLTTTGRTALAAAERAGEHVLRQIFGSLAPQQLTDLETLLTLINPPRSHTG